MPRGKKYSKEEIGRIVELHLEGRTNKQIAEEVRPGIKDAWRKVGEIIRDHKKNSTFDENPLMVSMSREQRTRYINDSFLKSSRGRTILETLFDDEKDLFMEEYERVHSEMESLTAAEDQMLATGIQSYVLAMRAQKAYKENEEIKTKLRKGDLSMTDPTQREMVKAAGSSEAYRKESIERMKEYREVMEKLKATRDKRLDKVRDQKKTLIDLFLELRDRDHQNSILEDVVTLNRMQEDELKRLLEGGEDPDHNPYPWLLGDFPDLT